MDLLLSPDDLLICLVQSFNTPELKGGTLKSDLLIGKVLALGVFEGEGKNAQDHTSGFRKRFIYLLTPRVAAQRTPDLTAERGIEWVGELGVIHPKGMRPARAVCRRY